MSSRGFFYVLLLSLHDESLLLQCFGHCLDCLSHKVKIKCVVLITVFVVVWISKVCCVGDHDGWYFRVPIKFVIAPCKSLNGLYSFRIVELQFLLLALSEASMLTELRLPTTRMKSPILGGLKIPGILIGISVSFSVDV